MTDDRLKVSEKELGAKFTEMKTISKETSELAAIVDHLLEEVKTVDIELFGQCTASISIRFDLAVDYSLLALETFPWR